MPGPGGRDFQQSYNCQAVVCLDHMAWPMASLENLSDFYNNLKEKNWPIHRVSGPGLSLGIYIKDPDGNGIEVCYKTPRE